MKYFKKTLEYLFKLEHGKRFFVLCLLAIPAGIAVAFTARTVVYYDYFKSFEISTLSFLNTFALGDLSDLKFMVIAGAVAFLGLIFGISVMSSVVSRNLRVGVFKLNLRLGYEINEAIIPSFSAIVTAFILVILAKIFQASLFMLASTFSSRILAIVLFICVVILELALVSFAISTAVLYLPYMTINGLNPISALTQSIHGIENTKGRLFLCVFIPVFLKYVIAGLVAMAENFIVSLVVESLMNVLVLVYFVTLSFVSYYEINELPREDYPRDYYYAKIRR